MYRSSSSSSSVNYYYGWKSFTEDEDRPEKPRRFGVTEMRSPNYSLLTQNTIQEILESMGEFVDGLKFSGGSHSLMPKAFIKEITDLAHRHDVYVSTGDWAEHLLRKGPSSFNQYIEECKQLGFDTIELNVGSLKVPEESLLRFIRLAKSYGLRVRPQLEVKFDRADMPVDGDRAFGAYIAPIHRSSEIVEDVNLLIRKAERCLEAGADMIMIDADDVCEHVDSLRADLIAKIIGRLGLEKTMFEASNTKASEWFVRRYGPKRKEAIDELPVDKRRKIGVENMTGPTSRPRQVFSTINGEKRSGKIPGDLMPAMGSDGGSSGVEFNCREDVERLLAEKMKGKNKMDLKGKNEQMMEYIKKLRACIKWFMELEDGYIMEQEKLQGLLQTAENRHEDSETQRNVQFKELSAIIEDLERQCLILRESLSRERDEKLVAIKSVEKESEARATSEKLQTSLSEDLERITQELERSNHQIKVLQETNRRLQEYNTSLQQYNSNLQADASKNGESISRLQKEKSAMMDTLTGLRDHSNLLKNQLDSSRSFQQEAVKHKEELKNEVGCLRSELQQVRDDREHLLAEVQVLAVEISNYKELTEKTSKDLDTMMTSNTALEEACSSQREQIKVLEHQLAAANEKLKSADLVALETMTEYQGQKNMIKDLQNRIADSEIQIIEGEKMRKQLHNTILELKGNIRVFCRVRPAVPDSDINDSGSAIISYPTSTEFVGRGIDLMYHTQKYSFTFDKVFTHEASQEVVFVEISQLVQSALGGYKVCIFAYGQTGSGKTYTMMGKPETPEQKGLIPRSLEQIFETSQSLQSQGWKYKMQASMLEIYNETIRDLLAANRPGIIEANGAPGKQYTIKHDSSGNTQVSDLTIVDVCSLREVSFLLRQAAQSRSVGRTQMNEQSSRSHFVFTLRISGVNESTEQQVQGVLNLIDLAGSERLAKSGSTGDRLKETQAINKSLSSLSDVIFAIAKKEDHVPYRNSKLTYLLQPCLGGDSKTLMFVNISPETSSAGESISSLRFAARVNSCEIGVPRRHTQLRPVDSRLSYG